MNSKCPVCASEFSCGVNEESCWCANVENVKINSKYTFCLCKNCLEEQVRLDEMEEYRNQMMNQFFEDGSCTGGPIKR